MLITGIAEWFWTAYCCIDTYFGNESTIQAHHESKHDALIGGSQRARWYPIWNPREYFLFILSSRFRQITREWDVVISTRKSIYRFTFVCLTFVCAMINRMQEASIFIGAAERAPLVDDASLNRTREYTWISELLRLLHNALIRFIESWENFEDGELQYFYGEEQQT